MGKVLAEFKYRDDPPHSDSFSAMRKPQSQGQG